MSEPVRDLRSGRVVRVRKAEGGRGMAEGLVWVEVYLPFDPSAYVDFVQLVGAHKGDAVAAAAADPELASKALTPIDAHGEAMLAGDVVALAHAYQVQSRKMDVGHDRQARASCQVVETFVNGPEIASPNFYPGSWVIVVKVAPGTPEWTALEAGTLDAVSFEGLVYKQPVTVQPVPEAP